VLRRHGQVFCVLSIVFDVIMIAAAWLLCYVVRFRLGLFPFKEAVPPQVAQFIGLLPLVISADLIFIALGGLYRLEGSRSLFEEQWKLVRAAVFGWLGLIAALYYYRSVPYSRVMLFMFLFANPLALLASRAVLRKTLRALGRSGWGVEHVAILGTGKLARKVLQRLRTSPVLGLQVDYFVDYSDEPQEAEIEGLPVRGTLSNLRTCLGTHFVDSVFVALGGGKSDKLQGILDVLEECPVDVVVIPDLTDVSLQNASTFEVQGMPMVQVRGMPMQGWRAAAKRLMDIVGSLLLLVVFALPMLLVALLIKRTSPGTVFYGQKRISLAGRPLTILKFRTMHEGAEEQTGPIWAGRDDPRCTRLGAFLRRTDLDELPQLFNVLRGEMSLVGPRPERPHFVGQFASRLPAYLLRHSVKAGITGWAQINGLRGNTSLEKRLEYDLYYINNWSLGFDLLVLLLTPFARFLRPHAR
jgi:exopolysaccharide biosynthesis polyprenyl glycosylphosphotransferase